MNRSAPSLLEYAPRSPRGRRRWLVGIAAAIALLAAVAGAWHYGPHAWQSARIWYWERQCMNFDPPAGSVAWEMLPAGSAKPTITGPFIDGDDPQIAVSGVIRAYTAPSGREMERYPTCYIRYLQAIGHWESGAVVFCHRLVSPAGHERLVVVTYPLSEQTGWGDAFQEFMSAMVYDRGAKGDIPLIRRLENTPHTVDWMGIHPLPMPTRLFAGHADPQDHSRFSIEFDWADGNHGILDGELRDDDRVILTIRGGPGGVDTERRRVFGH